MLVAALALAVVSFAALVAFVLTGQEWALWVVFASATLGASAVVADFWRKARADRRRRAEHLRSYNREP